MENKDIFIDLKKNKGGVYLKISERNSGGRNTVLIPASGIARLCSVLDEVVKSVAAPVAQPARSLFLLSFGSLPLISPAAERKSLVLMLPVLKFLLELYM